MASVLKIVCGVALVQVALFCPSKAEPEELRGDTGSNEAFLSKPSEAWGDGEGQVADSFSGQELRELPEKFAWEGMKDEDTMGRLERALRRLAALSEQGSEETEEAETGAGAGSTETASPYTEETGENESATPRRLEENADQDPSEENEEAEAGLSEAASPNTEESDVNDSATPRRLEASADQVNDASAIAESLGGLLLDATSDSPSAESSLELLSTIVDAVVQQASEEGSDSGVPRRLSDSGDDQLTEAEANVAQALGDVLMGSASSQSPLGQLTGLIEVMGSDLHEDVGLRRLSSVDEGYAEAVEDLGTLLNAASQTLESQESTRPDSGDGEKPAEPSQMTTEQFASIVKDLLSKAGKALRDGPVADAGRAAGAIKDKLVVGGEQIGRTTSAAKDRMVAAISRVLSRALLALGENNPEVLALSEELRAGLTEADEEREQGEEGEQPVVQA